MSWLEQKIRHYEHARWTTDDNRRVYPFEWGLEHIGGRADEPDPRGFLNAWVDETLAHSDEWFATTPADDYVLHPARERRLRRARAHVHQPDRFAVAEQQSRARALFPRARHRAGRRAAAQLECEVGRAGESLPLAEQAGHHAFCAFRCRITITASRPDTSARINWWARTSASRCRPRARPSRTRAAACAGWSSRDTRKLGLVGHQHRLGGRLDHHGARSGRARRRISARLHLFCRRRAHRHDHACTCGKVCAQRDRRRVAPLLDADQPRALHGPPARLRPAPADDQRALRSHVLVRIYRGNVSTTLRREGNSARNDDPAVRPLFAGACAVRVSGGCGWAYSA